MSRPLSLCLAYYENPSMLAIQVAALRALPDDLRRAVDLVVVDDGSPNEPAEPVFRRVVPAGMAARLYRMREDIPWNQDACRNLAVAEAPSTWLLLTDMDHVPSERLWRRLIARPLQSGVAYTMRRVRAPGLEPYKSHPNSFVMTRATFDKAGGYDERYAGVYGTDGMFRSRLKQVARIAEIKEALVLYSREVVPDASTRTLARKGEAADRAKVEVRELIAASGHPEPVRGLSAWDRLA